MNHGKRVDGRVERLGSLKLVQWIVLVAYYNALKESIDSGMRGALRKAELGLRLHGLGTTVKTVQRICTSALLHLLTKDERGEYVALWSMAAAGCRITWARAEMYFRTDVRYENRSFAIRVQSELERLLFSTECDEESETASGC